MLFVSRCYCCDYALLSAKPQGLLVVSANMCFLHLGNSKAYWKFLPTLGPIADLQLSAPTEEEEKDVDLVEERKILCFLEAISDFKTVGVELSGADPMEVEKWPLIQVYANAYAFQELRRQRFHYYMCPHTPIYVSSYCYCSRHVASKSWEDRVSLRCATCVLILRYMWIYVSSYYYICVLI